MNIQGKIKVIFDEQKFDSGFTKREFVVTTQEQYPQDIKLDLVKDKTSLLNGLSVGSDVTVHFNLRGNEYQNKYFVTLQAWKIEAGVVEPKAYDPDNLHETKSDLPF
jgi:single-strand DNA-binding protein